ncbi:hypothetical protein K431DRAFT_346568 [Polychaeton citri CBS 116435]|uniref:Uncharacterized protein n=1 Tax=Polychaeton citri CBS 116435 TaxID=1314669 RepID=A0A9P4Q786_9PEZI|nr:hypothetical protein K431DRAFT_346568 [Polychaeton citri CBS 116435]
MAIVVRPITRSSEKPSTRSSIAIITCQQSLLWSSLYIIASIVYLFITGAVHIGVLPAAVSLLFCSMVSIVYICLHNTAALLRRANETHRRRKRRLLIEWQARMMIRFLTTIWMLGCGVAIVFTIAKHPYCDFGGSSVNVMPIDFGSVCVVQRVGVGMSLSCLCISIGLFILLLKSSDPFSCHLFGTVQEPRDLFVQPSYPILKRSKYSEGSFKCRTSASLESERATLPCVVMPPPLPPTTQQMRKLSSLLPTRPDSASFGLGIYSQQHQQRHQKQQQQPQPTQPRFLTPRPSLHSIRSSTSLSRPPSILPPDPMPPLPVYLQQTYKRTPTAMLTAVHPPRRPNRPEHDVSDRSLRVIHPSPQPMQHTNSISSVTSIYSQTPTGERTGGLAPRLGRLSVLARSISEESVLIQRQQQWQSSVQSKDLSGAVPDMGHRLIPPESAIGIALDGFEHVRTIGGSSVKSLRRILLTLLMIEFHEHAAWCFQFLESEQH